MRYYVLITLFLALLSGVSFAVIIESGDGGKEFAANISIEKCSGSDVAAVYVCTGNVVKVVSTDSNEGPVFYKPDGRVIKCNPASPSVMGAECVQLLSPNLCPTASVCAETGPAPEESTVTPDNTSLVEPQPETQKPLAMNNTLPKTAPVQESQRQKPAAPAPGLSENEVLLLSIIIGGIVVLALTSYLYMRSR